MNAAMILTGMDLLLQFIDRTTAAAAVIRGSRAEGRPLTSAELASLRSSLNEHLDELDAEIARAKSGGR